MSKMEISNKKIILIIFVLLITHVVFGFVVYLSFGTWSDRGTFGDIFGGLNSFFSGLAFFGVIYAILLQKEALEIQHDELIMTRNVMKETQGSHEINARQQLLIAQINGVTAQIYLFRAFEGVGIPADEKSMISVAKKLKTLNEMAEAAMDEHVSRAKSDT